MNYTREDFVPVILQEKDQAWIIKHFKNTKNAEIAERFGISEGWLHRFARKHGLKKTSQFFHKCQLEAAAAAKESNLRNGTYPKKGTPVPGGEATRFQKGHRLPKASEAKRRESLRKSRQELVDREFLRVALGEPQKTKIKIGQDSPRRVQLRYYLRKLGYIIARGSKVAYYDETTRRSPEIESRKKGDKGYVYFEFKPLEENGTRI